MIRMTNEQLARLENRLKGLCSGAYMGDLLGFPWERMTREAILKETGGRGVEGTHTPFKPRYLDPQWGDRLQYRPSDDWRLTRAVGEALCNPRLYMDGMAHALAYLRAMREDATGWGPTVLAGLRPRQAWLDSGGLGGLDPSFPVPETDGNQSGTGVLMRTSLMALPALFELLADKPSETAMRAFLGRLFSLGRMTHAGDAVLVTIPYVLLIAQFLDPRRPDGGARVSLAQMERWREQVGYELGDRAYGLCYSALCAVWSRSSLVDEVSERYRLNGCDPRFTQEGRSPGGDAFLAQHAADPGKIGLTGAQYALAQALLLDSPGPSLPAAVLAAVNRGGDTDTHGCITGAYAGAFHGWHEDALPAWWKEHDAPARAFAAEMFERYVIPRVQVG